jgi:hypothetical protein
LDLGPPESLTEGSGDKVLDVANRIGGQIFDEADERQERRSRLGSFQRTAGRSGDNITDAGKNIGTIVKTGLYRPPVTGQLTKTPGVPVLNAAAKPVGIPEFTAGIAVLLVLVIDVIGRLAARETKPKGNGSGYNR